MPERFGSLLRRQRRDRAKTLGDLARFLEVSVAYVSDVERGNRNPFSTERILKIANFLGQDPTALMEAAGLERGLIEYDIRSASPLEAAVVGGLVTGLARGGISEEKLHTIQRILQGGDDEDE